MSNLREIELAHTHLYLNDNGILVIKFNDTTWFKLKEVLEVAQAMEQIAQNEELPVLVIAGKNTNIDSEGRRFVSSKDGLKNVKFHAFVIQSIAQRVIANIYLIVDKPFKPTRFFTNKEEAENWLLSCQE